MRRDTGPTARNGGCGRSSPDICALPHCHVARRRCVAGGLGRVVPGCTRQRSLARVSEIRRRPTPILLGSHHSELPQRARRGRHTAAKRFCREALVLDRRLFRLWHRFRGDLGARGSPLMRAELIAKVLPNFFTFVHEEGVEPTNNSAERALRTAPSAQLELEWDRTALGANVGLPSNRKRGQSRVRLSRFAADAPDSFAWPAPRPGTPRRVHSHQPAWARSQEPQDPTA
jgi:hypothetical protein